MYFYIIILFVVWIDQWSKYLARTYLKLNEHFAVWHRITLTLYENHGAAFGLLQGKGSLFLVIPLSLLFIGFVFYLRWKRMITSRVILSGCAILLGGGIGNVVDRIVFGKVTDFIQFKPSGGILNIADLMINLGILIIFLGFLIQFIMEKKQEPTNSKVQ
ncbi:MAG: signal peptidase [Bacilli bacterium]|nr:signal peptidase [Bacilli bacterium]